MEATYFSRYSANDSGLGNRQLTALDLREIKISLNTRDRNKILGALNKILELLNVRENSLRFITSDLPQYLCDVVNPSDIITNRLIFSCLEQMAQEEEFYTHNHSSYAIQSLVRSVKMLVKSNSNEIIIRETLTLLINILKGCGRMNLCEKTVTDDVIELVYLLSQNEFYNKEQISVLINGLLSLKILKVNKNLREIFFESIIQCFILKEGTDNLNPKIAEKIHLKCSLSEKVLRFLKITYKNLEECDSNIRLMDLKNDLVFKIRSFLIEVGIPYFAKLLIQSDICLRVLKNFFQALIYLFEEEGCNKGEVAKELAKMGFLFHVTNVITFAEGREGESLRKVCLDLLTKIILTLSDEIFVFPQMWLAGRDRFQEEVCRGISFLPLDASNWLDFLESPKTPLSSKLALVVYLYFYCLCSKRIDITSTIYPAVIAFLNSSRMTESWPILFIKAVWFILAMSFVSKLENSTLSEDEIFTKESEVATETIVRLIGSQNKFDLVYTHHIALPYWAFSSPNVSFDIQCKVLECWLQNSENGSKAIDELIETKLDAQLVLISILENGSILIAASAFQLLKPLIMDDRGDDRLITEIWMTLPSLLAAYTTDATKTANVDYMVELASMKSPKNCDVSKMIRTAGLLADIIVQSHAISILPCLKLALQLLEATIQLEDYRVAQLYIRSTDFLPKIMKKIKLESSEMAVYSLRIITCLWKLPDESDMFQIPPDVSKVNLNVDLLDILDRGDFQVTHAALQLLEELLIAEFESDIFNRIEYPDLDYFRELYFHLQTLIIKDLPNTKSLIWNCLKYCLTLKSPGAEEIVENLITNHWTHEIIRYSLKTSNDSPEMRSFLTVWIELNNKYEINTCSHLKMTESWFSESVKLIAKALINQNLSDDKILCKKILDSNVVLELQLREALDMRCRDL